jgi:hypothetical protein
VILFEQAEELSDFALEISIGFIGTLRRGEGGAGHQGKGKQTGGEGAELE